MLAIRADVVQIEDGDTLVVKTEQPLVVDSKKKEAWPKGQGDVDTDKSQYEVRRKPWVRVPNLDTHESYTEAGKEEKASFEDWLDKAEGGHDADMFELELYSPGSNVFDLDEYGRVLASVARLSDGDDWETSALTKFGNAVGWREQTPR